MKRTRAFFQPKDQEEQEKKVKKIKIKKKKHKKAKISSPSKRIYPETGQEFKLPISIPGVLIINGKSQSGKNHLLHQIFAERQHLFDYGILFTQTAFHDKDMPWIQNKYKHLGYQEKKLAKLMQLQASFPDEERPLAFVIFNDCIYDKKFKESKLLKLLASSTTHFNVFLVVLTQSVNRVNSDVRENAFQVALFQPDTYRYFKGAYDSYGQNYENIRQFYNYVCDNTKDKGYVFKDKHNNGEWFAARALPKKEPFQLTY